MSKVKNNIFYILDDLKNLSYFTKSDKIKKLSIFLEDFNNIEDLLKYFDHFNSNLSKKTLNSYLKSVINP